MVMCPQGDEPARGRALEVVRGGPAAQRVGVPAGALDPRVAVREPVARRRAPGRRAPRSTMRARAGPATGRAPPRRGGGASRSGRGRRPRRASRSRYRVPGPAAASTSSRVPAATTRPSAIPIASTQPGPSSPARVAIRPRTTSVARGVVGIVVAVRSDRTRSRRVVLVGGLGVGTGGRSDGASTATATSAASSLAAPRSRRRSSCSSSRATAAETGSRPAGFYGPVAFSLRSSGRSRPRRLIERMPATKIAAATRNSTLTLPTRSATGPDDDDRQEAGDRDEHVEDAEHAAADVLRDLLLELRLRRDRDERVGDAGEERDEHDDRQQRREVSERCRGPSPVSARWRSRAIGPAAASSASRMPSATSPPSMSRRRGKCWP